jgi:hypothetical protein
MTTYYVVTPVSREEWDKTGLPIPDPLAVPAPDEIDLKEHHQAVAQRLLSSIRNGDTVLFHVVQEVYFDYQVGNNLTKQIGIYTIFSVPTRIEIPVSEK